MKIKTFFESINQIQWLVWDVFTPQIVDQGQKLFQIRVTLRSEYGCGLGLDHSLLEG